MPFNRKFLIAGLIVFATCSPASAQTDIRRADLVNHDPATPDKGPLRYRPHQLARRELQEAWPLGGAAVAGVRILQWFVQGDEVRETVSVGERIVPLVCERVRDPVVPALLLRGIRDGDPFALAGVALEIPVAALRAKHRVHRDNDASGEKLRKRASIPSVAPAAQ